MKKSISINVGGIIFHIEENGHAELKNYLSAIDRHFYAYEDNPEIITDIESRIAEIFLSKLSDDKLVITREDVLAMIGIMGELKDFEDGLPADEGHQGQQEDPQDPSKMKAAYGEGGNFFEDIVNTPVGLKRDERRKLIGGVCAGIAFYFKIDPVWVRVLALLSFFDLFFSFAVTAFFLATYAILWIVLPGSDDLESDGAIRKFFRISENRVLGGVASGLGAFFGIDPTIIRVLFVASIFMGGIGVVFYLILWFITPETTYFEDKNGAQQPFSLSSVEESIKNSFHLDGKLDGKTGKQLLTKILLLPTRALIFIVDRLQTKLKPALKLIFNVLNILIGVGFLLGSIAFSVIMLVLIGVFYGVVHSPGPMVFNDIPFDLLKSSLPQVGLVFALISVWVPFVFLGIVGAALISKKTSSPVVNWSLLGVWIIALIGAGITVPLFFTEFQTKALDKRIETFNVPEGVVQLDVSQNGYFDEFSQVRLTLKGHGEDELLLVMLPESRGKTRQNAKENAENIQYTYQMRDSTLLFDTNYELKKGTPFRAQRLNLELWIPYGKEFQMSKGLGNVLLMTLNPAGYSVKDLGENRWMFNQEGKLTCITCQVEEDLEPTLKSNRQTIRGLIDEAIHEATNSY